MDREILLDKYLMNELNEYEIHLFNNLVETDEDFKDEVEIRSVLFADFKTDIKKDLIKNISSTKLKRGVPKATIDGQQSVGRLALLRRILPIAAILLLGLLGLWFFQNNIQKDFPQIAMQLLNEAPPSIPVLMDTSPKNDLNWNKAVAAYQKNEYQLAATFLEQSQAKTGQHHFYLGLSYLHQKPPLSKKAVDQLKQLTNANSKYAEEANWYISLAYLAEDETDNAKSYLKRIPTESGYYKKAQEVLGMIH